MKKTLKGTIVSDKMQNTVVVKVDRIVQHPKYRKRYRVSTRYKADNQQLSCQTGDFVLIEECRPISKDKRWKVKEVIVAGVAGTSELDTQTESSDLRK